jgi:formylglycine-generating enzyme
MRALLTILALLLLPASPAQATQPLPHEVTINGVEFVLIPEGWFWYSVFALDISEHSDDRLRYREAKVWLDSYYIAKFEARASDLARFMNAGGASNEALEGFAAYIKLMREEDAKGGEDCTVIRRAGGGYKEAEPGRNLPATSLSWTLADEFARWMGFRLPTEAEWEKTARGPDKRFWPWGDQYPDDTHAVVDWTSACDPAPVDSYPKGRSPYGVHHMAGNAGEYVADWYNQKFDNEVRDGMRNPPSPPEGSEVPYMDPAKIVKGGRWSLDAVASAIAARRLMVPHGSSSREGARFALDAATVRRHIDNGTAVVTRQ